MVLILLEPQHWMCSHSRRFTRLCCARHVLLREQPPTLAHRARRARAALTLHLAAPGKGAVERQLLLHAHAPAATAAASVISAAKMMRRTITAATASAAAAGLFQPLDSHNMGRGGPEIDAAELNKWNKWMN